MLTPDEIWQALRDVKDPEIPVVSVVEMGIVREVVVEAGRVTVTMTPTFSGCPALHVMKAEIENRVKQLGAESVEVIVALAPRWTTDWITDEARAKLKAFGLAPPPVHHGDVNVMFLDTASCPYCGSNDTSIKNTFGPTLCRTIYYCNACQQPFEQFKPV
ncbi:MAG TPA: 1,2-phenylacetyl-CoA epoxidase subunit PaaD [Anaerolineales bacterium]|nr:1,2-phenylacetyl-CoA epoxidase subunit PaaD [Anaerolineales bacterium]